MISPAWPPPLPRHPIRLEPRLVDRPCHRLGGFSLRGLFHLGESLSLAAWLGLRKNTLEILKRKSKRLPKANISKQFFTIPNFGQLLSKNLKETDSSSASKRHSTARTSRPSARLPLLPAAAPRPRNSGDERLVSFGSRSLRVATCRKIFKPFLVCCHSKWEFG